MASREKLNKHSKKVFDILNSDFPELLEYASKSSSDEDGFSLKVEIESPNRSVEFGLFFDTKDNRFTVGFDSFHCHFYSFAGTDFRSELSNAINVIKDIMRNELFVAKCLKNEEYKGSFLVEKKKLIPDEIRNHECIESDCDKVKIISWTGDFDAEIILSKSELKNKISYKAINWLMKLFKNSLPAANAVF